VLLLLVLVVVVLLVHPPNSSSAATLGANPPDAPGTIGWLANDAHPISLDAVFVDGLSGSGAGAAFGGSELAQALPPHTSEFPHALAPSELRGLEAVDVTAGGLGFAWAAERLKTDDEGAAVVGANAG
jgi:hypothetical protein